MKAGGSELKCMAHVKFIVLPAPTYRSGPPSIVAVGTVIKNDFLFFSLTVFSSIVSITHTILTVLRLRDTKIHESREPSSREWPLGDDIRRAKRTRLLYWFARTNEPKLFIESQGHCNWNNETRFGRIALSKIRFKSFSPGDVNTSGSLIYEMSVREERDFKVTSVFHTLVRNPEKPMRKVIKTGSFVTVAIHIDYV